MLNSRQNVPATNSCMAVFIKSEFPAGLYFEISEPLVQAMPPVIKTRIAPIRSAGAIAPDDSGWVKFINNKTPINPMINQRIRILFEKLLDQCLLSSKMNQKGTEVTIIAAVLLGKYCSAQVTDTVPPTSINIPQTEFFKNEAISGCRSFLVRQNT